MRKLHYAWVVAGLTFLILLAAAGVRAAVTVLILPLEAEFGWTRATISLAVSTNLLLFGLMGPFAAALMQRVGVKRTVLTSLSLLAAGVLLTTRMTHAWQLVALWGVTIGLGAGMMALVLGATITNRWFAQRRGLVLGVLTAATATGQLAFLPLAVWLAQTEGWRAAMLPGLGACALAGVLMLLFGRDHPAELGLNAYGDASEAVAPRPSAPAGNAVRNAFSALAEASGSRVFWILFATFLVCGLSTNGLIQTHFIPLCSDFGMAEVQAASVLAMMGAFDFVGTIASGWLSDRYDNRALLAWYYGLRGLSLLLLPLSDFSLYGLTLFAVFYG